jgi:hypothetical protein
MSLTRHDAPELPVIGPVGRRTGHGGDAGRPLFTGGGGYPPDWWIWASPATAAGAAIQIRWVFALTSNPSRRSPIADR